MKIKFSASTSRWILLLLLSGPTCLLDAQVLLSRYDFNQTGSAVTNVANPGTYDVILKNNAGTSTDLHSVDGGGVTGGSGDYAFNNTSATGMGNLGTGGMASVSGGSPMLSGLASFTVTGWYYSVSAMGNSARIFTTSDAKVFSQVSRSSGIMQIQLNVNGVAATINTSSSDLDTTGKWTFFAIAYTGSTAKFYYGDSATSTILLSTVGLAGGNVGMTTGDLLIGNVAAGNRPLQATLDDFRVYDGLFASTSALDTVRVNGLTAIPEPSTCSTLMITVLPLLMGIARFAKRLKQISV